MKVFISWSGERSKKVAELFDSWVKCVIQAAEPWMSSKDIDRGALWFTEISDQLADTCIGIVFLTNENKNKPWILFESGALAKGLSSNRVCTFLIDLIPTDLENPLAQFNHTLPTREGINHLVRTINRSLKDFALKEAILEKVFDTYWPQFEVEFSNIIKTTPDTEVKETRKGNDIMLDVLSTVRMLDKRLRNIEVSNETKSAKKVFQDSDHNLKNMPLLSPADAIQKIKQYMKEDVPHSEIMENLFNLYGINQPWTARHIDHILREVENN